MESVRRPVTQVFVINDHAIVRHGLAAMLLADRGLRWVGDAGSVEDAFKVAPALGPDIVLVDLALAEKDGASTLHAMRALLPTARFIVLTCSLRSLEVRRALDAGADNLLLRNASWQVLIAVVRATAAGHRLLVPAEEDALAPVTSQGKPETALTSRERELLVLMALGRSNKQISKELGIAVPTVKFHVTHIIGKLAVVNRTGAVLAALKLGLVSLH